MAQQSLEMYILLLLRSRKWVQVPEKTWDNFVGLTKEEAESFALTNELNIQFLESKLNDVHGAFKFSKGKEGG